MKNLLVRFVRHEEGQDLAEYGMLVAFIAFIVLAGVTTFGANLNIWWGNVAGRVATWAP